MADYWLSRATVITALVPQSFFLQWGNGVLAMLGMVLVGLPMYICATASTPVAAGLLFAGISPGAALVFMLTGPATNLATMGVIKEQLGLKSLVAYLFGVIGTAIAVGLALNAAYSVFLLALADGCGCPRRELSNLAPARGCYTGWLGAPCLDTAVFPCGRGSSGSEPQTSCSRKDDGAGSCSYPQILLAGFAGNPVLAIKVKHPVCLSRAGCSGRASSIVRSAE